MTADELRARTEAVTWWHGGMDLGHGVVTQGRVWPALDLLPRLGLPADLSGKRVLDVGTWDGFMAFECERRGATVVAVDSHAWDVANAHLTHNPTGRAGFDLAHEALDSGVIAWQVEVLDLSPQLLGTFDLVLFLGVLYHMRHPLLALERVAALTHDALIVESHVDLGDVDAPAMRFYPGREVNDDASNWWGPNPACIEAMLRDVGFPCVRRASIVANRAVIHARRH